MTFNMWTKKMNEYFTKTLGEHYFGVLEKDGGSPISDFIYDYISAGSVPENQLLEFSASLDEDVRHAFIDTYAAYYNGEYNEELERLENEAEVSDD